MAVKQQLMNTDWITDRDTPVDYLAVIVHLRCQRKVGDRVRVMNEGAPENARPFGGQRGTVVAVKPGGQFVELRIKDGAHIFHVAFLASSTERVSR